MGKTTKKNKAKAKGTSPAKKPIKKVSAKAKSPAKVKEVKAKRTKTPVVLSDDYMKTGAYQGTREVARAVDKVAPRETENVGPVKLLERVGRLLQKKHGKGKDGLPKFRFSTAHNIKGTIFVYRHVDLPGKAVLLRTYDSELYDGKIGCGRPVFNGSPTKTGGAALKEQKLAGLIPQKNKPDNYWWFNADPKNEKAILKFMGAVGF